jgi:glycosyltransferase involved in cell wall biosynthesis
MDHMSPDRPIRITYSVPAALGVGGMGRGMLASVQAALAEGWDVQVLCAPGGIELPGATLHTIDTGRLLALAQLTPARFSPAWLRLIGERAHDRRARRLVGRPDLFQVSGGAGLESLRAARDSGAVTVLESMNAHARHVDDVMRREEKLAGSRAHFHNRRTVERCEAEYAAADFVLCNSSYTERTLVEGGVPAARVWRIPHGVALPEQCARHEEGAPFRALFVGSLDLRKGFRHLLRAWELLRPAGAELYLRGGTGDRPCRKLLESWRSRIAFTVDGEYGPVPYHRFSVLVLPSISDGFGLVVLEAMAAGLPVIVTQNVGAADCVREGIDGFVVPVADPEAIAARLEVLCRDRTRLAEMGRAARGRAGEFTTAAYQSSYAEKLRRAIAGRG